MRIIVLPEQRMTESSLTGKQADELSCQLLSAPYGPKTPGSKLLKSIKHLLTNSEAQSAVVVLPLNFANGKNMKFWPDICFPTRTGSAVISVFFADSRENCISLFNTLNYSSSGKQVWNATCQYQPPYTDTFDLWVKAGAKSIHPGDFFKQEFLEEVARMTGHWLYWGHSDNNKLRGYHHVYSKELLAHKPEHPLISTLWFSCSTLNNNSSNSIGLEWYLSGATHCLMASPVEVNTEANCFLAKAWLEACQDSKDKTIAGIIGHLLEKDEPIITDTLKQYKLLGSPWVRFGG